MFIFSEIEAVLAPIVNDEDKEAIIFSLTTGETK